MDPTGKRAIKIERDETSLDEDEATGYADYIEFHNRTLQSTPGFEMGIRLNFELNNTGDLVETPTPNQNLDLFMQDVIDAFGFLSHQAGAILNLRLGYMQFQGFASTREISYFSDGNTWISNTSKHNPPNLLESPTFNILTNNL